LNEPEPREMKATEVWLRLSEKHDAFVKCPRAKFYSVLLCVSSAFSASLR